MEPTSQRHVPVILFVVAIVLLGARVGSHYVRPAASATAVQWISLDELQGRGSDRPILFLFTADWSAPGRALETEVLQDGEVAGTINERFLAVRVVDRKREDGANAPRVEGLEQRFSVRAFPTIVLSDASGNELVRMDGFHGKEEVEQILGRVR